jgi:AbrB family looped-hinge helix DNA binding protein
MALASVRYNGITNSVFLRCDVESAQLVRVSSKGRIVIPKKMRDAMHLEAGDYLVIDGLPDGGIIAEKPSLEALDALLKSGRGDTRTQGFVGEELCHLIKRHRAKPQDPRPNT